MNQERVSELKEDFCSALLRLKEALTEDYLKNSLFVDATIQRFEFTYELAWKLAKAVMEQGGKDLTIVYPRMIIKEAYSCGLITDGDTWLKMLEDRNKTSHIYDEKQALAIYKRIKDDYYNLLENFQKNIEKFIK